MAGGNKRPLRGRVRDEDRLFFAMHLAMLLRVGVSLPKAIGQLSPEVQSGHFRRTLEDVRNSIIGGKTLSESAEKHVAVFGREFVDMARMGEIRGGIADALGVYYSLTKRNLTLRRKFRSALIYPSIVLLAALVVSAVAAVYVFPEIRKLFVGVDAQLPLLTRMVIAAMDVVGSNVGAIGAVAGALAVSIAVLMSSRLGSALIDRIVLRLPVFSRILKARYVAALSANLAELLKAGVPILDAIDAASDSIGNSAYRTSLREAKEGVIHGNLFSDALKRYPGLYPSSLVTVVAVGEESGMLSSALAEASSFYESQAYEILEDMPAIIEPVIILFIGGFVALLAVAIMMPLYSLTASI